MKVRLVEAPASGSGRLAAVGKELRRLQDEEDRSTLYISVERPAEVVLEGLREAGVDVDRVFIVDAVSGMGGTRVSDDPEHIMYVSGPDLLEMLALRAEKIIRSKAEGPALIVIDSVDAFALYNESEALKEIVHYIVHRLEKGVRLDFLVAPGGRSDADLLSFLSQYVDETIQLE